MGFQEGFSLVRPMIGKWVKYIAMIFGIHVESEGPQGPQKNVERGLYPRTAVVALQSR